MAAREVFVDTSALYALIDKRDSHHDKAKAAASKLLRSGRRLVTTDYVVAESVNLANARAGSILGARILDLLEQSASIRIEWITSARFESTKRFFRRHVDHRYSFTDCASFIVMRELDVTDALTTDRHYVEAGFVSLL